MTDSILITGPSLAPAAADVLVEAGYAPVYVPPYSGGDGLIAEEANAVSVAEHAIALLFAVAKR